MRCSRVRKKRVERSELVCGIGLTLKGEAEESGFPPHIKYGVGSRENNDVAHFPIFGAFIQSLTQEFGRGYSQGWGKRAAITPTGL